MIDIHRHTIYSDGSFLVKELLKEAESKGLTLLSITDHNTIRAYYELKDSHIRCLFTGNIISNYNFRHINNIIILITNSSTNSTTSCIYTKC